MSSKIGWQLTPSSLIGNEFIDGSTEIFKSGKWAFLTREVIQNSLDALNESEEKLVMKFSLDDISTDLIPDKESIIKHLNGTLSIANLPSRCESFTKYAKKQLENEIIRVLKISDYNTTGVTGSEKVNRDTNSAWNALIYDEGNSQKASETSTGSFGTGKNAPFALSGLNTVFYVTKDINGMYAFEGVAKLFTSYIDGVKIERKIYYAKKNEDGSLSALDYNDSVNNLNKIFHRNEIGSDVIILGVDFDREQIKREIIQSIVENFFVLIYENKLDIDVFDEIINKGTLWNVIYKYCEKPIEYTNSNIKYGFIKQYLSVYSNLYETKEFCEDVVGAGKLRLLIAKGNDITGKWVAMFRNNGMKIFDNNIRTSEQNYSALFFPGDTDVDKFLREIENPTHDFFDPEVRIADPVLKQQAIRRYSQIKNWIRKKIEEYTEIKVSDTDYLDGMEEYIELDDTENNNSIISNPEIEIISYENKTNTRNLMIESDIKAGDEGISDFKENDGKSNTKKEFKGENTNEKGNDGFGLIKDYHNKFKVSPKVISNNNVMKIAFSLEDYNNSKFNLEIESIGEDNTVSNDIPLIEKAVNEINGKELKVKENKIIGIDTLSTNLVTIYFNRNFESKYRINVYNLGGVDNEN